MRMKLLPTIANSIEIEACVLTTPEAVDRFIRALQEAKKIVWKTALTEKK